MASAAQASGGRAPAPCIPGPSAPAHPHPGPQTRSVIGHFGFSYVGTAFLVALFVPNLVWAFAARPQGYETLSEGRVLRLVERVGQVLTVAAAVLFSDTNLRAWTPWSWWLVGACLLMTAYEACWVRYFVSARTMADFLQPLFGIPVPLAVLPVAAFLLLGVYGRLLPLIAAAVVLGVGHIGIHLQHLRRVRSQQRAAVQSRRE